MARYDIYCNPGRSKAVIPYLVDIQSNVISGLATRIVVPARPMSRFKSLKMPADLFPIIRVKGKDYFLDMPQLGAIPANELKNTVGSAQPHHLEIQTALDRTFGAY